MGKAWSALEIHVPGCDPQLQELVLAELDDFQPTAIQEPEEQSMLRAFFSSGHERDAAAQRLRTAFGAHLFVEAIEVEDLDWAARSQRELRAITVGRITVAPPWDVPESISLTIVIKPSMGFGTGHHATTRLMLAALQTLDLRDVHLLDIGCGSGVLAIAAIRLGAGAATAVDIDPDALQSAEENLALNGVSGRIRLQQCDFRGLIGRFSVVLANLTGALLEQSAEKLAELVEPEGYLIVSGFTDTEVAVVPSLQPFLSLQSSHHEDGWLCAVFCKSNRQTLAADL